MINKTSPVIDVYKAFLKILKFTEKEAQTTRSHIHVFFPETLIRPSNMGMVREIFTS